MWNIIPLDVDIKKKNHYHIEVNQADDVCFNMRLYSNGQPLSLVDEEDTIIVNYANANGTVTGDSNIGKTMSKSGAMIYLPRNCTNSTGTAHMQVTINTNKTYVSNKQTTSFPIDIKICRSVVDGKEVSQNVNSMIDNINKATIKGQETIKNIEETASKYTPASQLYNDVEDLKVREYGAENLLKDSGFLSGNIGEGFPWRTYGATATIEDSSSSLYGKMIKVVNGSTAYRGIFQHVDNNRHKDYYTVSFRIKGTKGNQIHIGLSGSGNFIYTIKNTDIWENVNLTLNNTNKLWDSNLVLYAVEPSTTFYIEDIALWEGKNAFTYKPNSNECLYDRIRISGKDVLGITKSGKYSGTDCINSPFSAGVWAYYDVDVHSATYKKIVAWSYSSKSVYYNILYNGTWLGWEQLTTQTMAKNPANITQDSTHRFVTDAEKNKWNMVTGSGALQQSSYCKLPNGLMIQWGATNVSVPSKSSATATATFPTPFPNKLLTIQTNVNRNISTMDKTGCENIIVNGIMANGVDTDKAGVPIFAKDVIGSGSNWTFEVGWIAIGY